MNVVLVAVHPYPSPQAVPLANAFLAAFLATDEGLAGQISLSLQDFILPVDTAVCADRILGGNPEAVGFSVYLWNREATRLIAAELRRRRPELVLFAGGPEPTGDPARILEEIALDFVISGEGEIPFVTAMGQLVETGLVAGGGGIFLAGSARPIPPTTPIVKIPDTIPSPYLTGILPLTGSDGVLWQLSRGCAFACEFCADRHGSGSVRRFSLDRAAAELGLFARKRVAQVFVLDSTFNLDMKRSKRLLRMIREQAPRIHFHFEVRSEFIDAELAQLFAEITCSLQIGLQSADPRVNRDMGRNFDPHAFTESIALLNQSGAIFGFDLIYGLPGDTLAGFAASLDFALELLPNHLDIFPLALLPGTRLGDRAAELGLSWRQVPPYTIEELPGFPSGDLALAARLASACDLFYSRGKAVAWFLPVVAPLELAPSAFLARFADRLPHGAEGIREADYDDEAIWQLQRVFVTERYHAAGLDSFLPVALDLIDYHYHYAAALMAPLPEIPSDRDLDRLDLLTVPLSPAPGMRLARFHYDLFDILEAGDFDLAEFTACFSPTGSRSVIWPKADEILSESLLEPYFILLGRFDGRAAAASLASDLPFTADELRSFLEFAVAEGILLIDFFT